MRSHLPSLDECGQKGADLYRLSGIISLLVGVFALGYSYYALSPGRLADPGPGLWPLLASIVVVACSVGLLVMERDDEDYERFTSGILTVGSGLLSLSVFTLLFEQIGFVVPGFLAFVFWLRFIGNESWRLSLTIALVATIAFYTVFVVLLGVPFPSGVFGF